MRQFALLALMVCLLLGSATQVAWAHPGHAGHHEFADGWWHPLQGLDHLLAMVAVGLLAVRIGGHGIWIMPCTFLGSMLLGGALAAMGLPVPGVELGIQASVLMLGLMIATAWIVPLPLGMALVGFFAAFHGYAHAAEMVEGGSLSTYAAGFLLATAVLHLCGIAAGIVLAKSLNSKAVRWAGGAITAASLLLILGLI